MPQSEDIPISDALRRFDQLAVLNDQPLEEIARHVKMRRAVRGTCLLEIGSHDTRLLFLLDGEELVGAKQNRIVNVTMLVAAHTTIVIPV